MIQAPPGYFAAALPTSSSICCSGLTRGSKAFDWFLGLDIILTPLGADPVCSSHCSCFRSALYSCAQSSCQSFLGVSACSCFLVDPLPFQLRCQPWPLPPAPIPHAAFSSHGSGCPSPHPPHQALGSLRVEPVLPHSSPDCWPRAGPDHVWTSEGHMVNKQMTRC